MADAKFISDAEAAHNRHRADHGVPPLTHSKDLSKMAQNWANHIAKKGCLSHSSHADRKHKGVHCGENCAMSFTSSGDDFTGEQVVENWYSEIVRYDFNKHGGPSTGHFTQVVWKDSREFGIGKAKAKDGAWYVCANYCPAGNMMGDNDKNVFPSGKAYTPPAKSTPAKASSPATASPSSTASGLMKPMREMNMKKSTSKSTSVSTSTSRGPDGKTTIKKITTETLIDEDGNETKNITEEETTK